MEKEHFALLAGQVSLLSQLSKSAVLRLSPGLVRAVLRCDEDVFTAYASIQADRIFSEYRVESKADNVIAVELLLANLAHALKSGASAVRTTLKLSKRGAAPFLSVVTSTIEGGVDVTQDVPCRVIALSELDRYLEPALPPPDIRLTFPSPRPLSSVLDHMRTLSKHVRIHADRTLGQATFAVRSEALTMRTFFRELVPADETAAAMGAGYDDGDKPAEVTATVASKHIAKAVHSVAELGQPVLLCIIPTRAVVIHVDTAASALSTTFVIQVADTGAGDEAVM